MVGESGLPGRRAGRHETVWMFGALVVVGLMVVGGGLSLGATRPASTFSSAGASTAGGPSVNATCNPPNPAPLNASPSALDIPALNPNVTLKPGQIIGSTYQFEVVNFTTADLGLVIEMPALINDFPTTTGVFHLNRAAVGTVTITGPGWTNPFRGTVKKTLHTTTTFVAGQNVTFTSAKLAVMANASYGSLTLAFRWHWSYGPTGGPVKNGPWTVPNASYIKRTPYLPSSFFPAL
ncbi:MAG: hypothetical protein L3K09_00210, partial [Thermoplasmata archaeon]|nr:hypothetical protein [Thermoplasmata archaeon]